MASQTPTASATPAAAVATTLSLTLLETHREVPIYLLEYMVPTGLDRRVQEEEMRRLEELPHPRFAVVANYQNLIVSGEYSSAEQLAVHQSPRMAEMRKRMVAVARYNPSSLTSLIRTMIVHVYARQGTSSGFAIDQNAALSQVRRAIERGE